MNIKFDFTKQRQINAAIENQEVAVMPAALAQKLLGMYSEQLSSATVDYIINKHIETLRQCKGEISLDGAINASLTWVAERELIQNINNENWDAYKVTKEEPSFPRGSYVEG